MDCVLIVQRKALYRLSDEFGLLPYTPRLSTVPDRSGDTRVERRIYARCPRLPCNRRHKRRPLVLTPAIPAAADTGPSIALLPGEQQLLMYDQQCEALAVDDCATYDPATYDSNWATFENPATGED